MMEDDRKKPEPNDIQKGDAVAGVSQMTDEDLGTVYTYLSAVPTQMPTRTPNARRRSIRPMKVAIVTGAGTGIGKASALELFKEGFAVVLAGTACRNHSKPLRQRVRRRGRRRWSCPAMSPIRPR